MIPYDSKPMKIPFAQAVTIPEDLFINILSRLPVKSLMRFRCVCKSFDTIIFDPSFIKLHLERSKRNPQLLLQWVRYSDKDSTVMPYPVRDIVENRLITIVKNSGFVVENPFRVVGSCNGLICLSGYSLAGEPEEGWIHLWNPAMRSMSDRLGIFPLRTTSFKCFFGFDNSTDTYKVVMVDSNGEEENDASKVRIFNSGNNLWKELEDFPTSICEDDGFYFRGTLNWLDEFGINSLDLGTETFTKMLLPPDFDEDPHIDTHLALLMDCFCFCHDSKGTHFIIWKMMEFGIKDSWTQLLKVSYQDLHMFHMADNVSVHLSPLYLYNGVTLIFTSLDEDQVILYNMTDNRVERTRIDIEDKWWVFFMDYVESLVSPY